MKVIGTLRFALEALLRMRGTMPRIGEVAPELSASDQFGNTIRLSDFRGKRVVLWFYPKADTPG